MQSDMDLDLEFFMLLSYMKSRKEKLILMSGLTGSGKTTILNKIHTKGVLTEILTPGFSVEMLRHPYTSIAAFDVGDENMIPPLYMQHFQNTKGLIFVIDSNDRNRVLEARDELHKLLNEDELRNATVLVLANKNDLPNAMTTAQLTEELGMKSLIAKQRLIYSTCATTGHGLLGGLDVFFKTIDSTVLHMHILICAGEEMQSTVQHVFTQTDWKTVIGANPELKFTCVTRVDYVEDQVEEAEAASYPVDMIILGYNEVVRYNEVVDQGLATMKELISQWKRAGFEGCLVGMGKEVEAELMNFVDVFFPYDCITNIEQLLTVIGVQLGNRALKRGISRTKRIKLGSYTN